MPIFGDAYIHLTPVVKSPLCELYTMVGNFRKVFIFVFFASQEPFARKLKPRKFCCPRVKRTNRVSIPGLLLYSSLQKRVSEGAFDGYHSKMLRKHGRTIQIAAQGRERKQSPRVPDLPIAKIKTAKISEIGSLAYFAKICTRENYQPYIFD